MNSKVLLFAIISLSIPIPNTVFASQLRFYQNLSFDSKVVSKGTVGESPAKPEIPAEQEPEADPDITTCQYNTLNSMWRTQRTTGLSAALWNGYTVGQADAGATSLVSGGITYYRGAENGGPRNFQYFEICRTTKKSMGQGIWNQISATDSGWSYVSEDPTNYYDCTYTPMASEMPAGQKFETSATNCKMTTVRTVQNREMNSMTFEIRNAGQPYTETSYEVSQGTFITTLTGTGQAAK
ncbi:hypothetical protein RYA05_04630 [Pseudomonas syringae pv. actinidiae]|nr:hypothetical protein [Pseudomonas syringae pv. actinidiae]